MCIIFFRFYKRFIEFVLCIFFYIVFDEVKLVGNFDVLSKNCLFFL